MSDDIRRLAHLAGLDLETTKAYIEAVASSAARPPPGTPTNRVVASTSTLAVPIEATGINTLVMSVTTDCYIRFGLSTVAAATATDYPLFANTEYAWEVDSNTITHYRLIRKSADGFAFAYVVGGD